MSALRRRAVDGDRQRHRVAVFSEFRQLKLDAALHGRLPAGEFPDLVGVVVHGEGRTGRGCQAGCKGAGADVQRLAAVQSSRHNIPHFNVARNATTSSTCWAVRIGLPRNSGRTRLSPSTRYKAGMTVSSPNTFLAL